jgi:hypothetical protein
MKLITEEIVDTQVLTEGEGLTKRMYISGPFLQGAIKNRNGRIYPMEVLQPETERYIREHIEVGSGWGELEHPASPKISPERISHRTVSLKLEGTDYIGKALIIKDNPCGAVVAGLINSGGRVGVSSRGLGSLKEDSGAMVVQNDFRLATCADVVLDPSAPSAWVNGIMEGVSFAVTDDGRLVEEEAKKALKKMSLRELSEKREIAMTTLFKRLIKS